ncbi:MAG: ribosome-associated translation inhibitor RaiA [Endozoicomonadaceae bacterium]|nr:ribosome-associated translation inhibitor RaiA [Endozoicomonadaceae bacterium]
MQINISGHHVDVTEAMKEYVHKRLNRIVAHYDNINNIQITLSIEKMVQRAEANLHFNNVDIIASAEHADMYAAIDLLADKLNRQLTKQKEKKLGRNGKNQNIL